jgi:hypothetical protein
VSSGPVGVIFSVSEKDVANGVDYLFHRLVRWREPVVSEGGVRVAIPREGRKIEDQTIDLLTPTEQRITGVRAETAVRGERTVVYDVPGMLWQTLDDGVSLTAMDLAQYAEDAGTVIVDRRGWGAIVGEIEVLDTVAGEPGDYIDTEAPHQVNALVGQSPVAQRGGTRKVQIIGRTAKPGTAMLYLEDAGLLAQTLPTPEEPPEDGAIPVPEFTLAADVDEPLTVAVATVTNDTALEDVGAIVEWEYAVSETEPVAAGTAFGPLALGFGIDTIDVPAVPSGSTVWVRARAKVLATGVFSDWSDWQSITLGPDDDGTGGVLPPFDLELAYDSGGVLSATATSLVAAITSVYFVAGDDTGAAPTYAATLLGTLDASGPPFTAASLATMAVGETRTVGAIGEDALDNRTTLILATITRLTPGDLDPGVGAGTPGNLRVTFHTGPPRVFRGIGATLDEPVGMKGWRKSENTGSIGRARLQHNCRSSSGGDLELHLTYSLDKFATDPIETGVFVRADRTQFPEVGEYLPIDELALGDNVTLGVATKGGDGTSVLITENVYLDAVSSEAPPALPPEVDLPQGGPLGTLILKHDARTVLDNGQTEGSSLTSIPDDTTITGPSSPHTASSVQSAPIFHTSGFGGGSLPRWSVDSTKGVSGPIPSVDGCTFYFVVDVTSGAGSNGDGQTRNAPIMLTLSAPQQGGFVDVRADGKLHACVNEGAFATPSKTGSVDRTDGPHVIALSWNRGSGFWSVFVDAALEMTASHAVVTNSWFGLTEIFYGNVNGLDVLTADYGFIGCWDLPHDATGVATVTAALQGIWGTP